MRRILPLVSLSILVLLGCTDGEVTGPSFVEVDGVELELKLNPVTLDVGSSFEAKVTIRNSSENVLRLAPAGCMLHLHVRRNGVRQEQFSGIRFLCLDRDWELSPSESLEFDYDIMAQHEGRFPPPGEYVLEIEFAENLEFPTLRKPFVLE